MDTQKLKSLLSNRRVILGAVTAGSLAVGFASGFKTAQSKLEARYHLELQQEIAEVKRYYSEQRVVQAVKPDPKELLDKIYSEEAQAAREAHESYLGSTGEDGQHLVEHPPVSGDTIVAPDGTLMTKELQGEPLVDDTDPETAAALQETVEGRVRGNVFAGKEPVEDEGEWDYEMELRIRAENPDVPYILHHDEYFENETEYEQSTLTYYVGDDTLVDEASMPVGDDASVVGNNALTAFGHGSKDKNVVYVRNEALEMDFEIVKDERKFSVHVLGFDDDDEGTSLTHSQRRFRMDRDD